MTIYDFFMFLLQTQLNQMMTTNVSSVTSNEIIPEKTSMDMSTLRLKTVNKCCPAYQHYIEDGNHRLMCGNVSTIFNAISIGNEGFQFLQQYPCETALGMYINNFEKFDVNGLGFVTYKKKIYPKACIDYDTKRQKWIIMKCDIGKNVQRTTKGIQNSSVTTIKSNKGQVNYTNEVDFDENDVLTTTDDLTTEAHIES